MHHHETITISPAFELHHEGAHLSPLVLNSPHSGRVYPETFIKASRLDALTLRRSEDAYVDELFMQATRRGVPLLRAHFPRAFLDVNREPYELDPRMFRDRLPAFANTRSVRVAGGLGTIARIVAEREEIYEKPLNVEEALERIENYHKPYHRVLKQLLHKVRHQFGYVVMLDCHSMPSTLRGAPEKTKADIVLGDRYGTSCAPGILDLLQSHCEALGFKVARNKPFAGGFITEHYGAPSHGLHVIQLEINRGLYLNEMTCEKTLGFESLQQKLTRLVDSLQSHLDSAVHQARLAAE